MRLSRLHDHLRQRGHASPADLAQAVDSTPAAIEAMLNLLERKGKVGRLTPGSSFGVVCSQCDHTALTLYAVVESRES